MLGEEYLGVNAAITNLIAVLSLAELGFSQAIAYLLYKPLSDKNIGKTLSYINYFKKIYLYIGYFIIFAGISLLPFLKNLIPTTINTTELNIIFLLFVANSSVTYFWSYKRTLIIADQKNYKIIPVISIFQTLDLAIKSLFLFLIKDFIFILCLQLILKLLENYFVNRKINKLYSNMFSKTETPLTNDEKKIINNKTIATFYHRIGDVFVNSTENIIISAFIGVSILGIYSNYTLLVALSTSFLSVLFKSIIASFGNLIVEKKHKSEESFYIIQLLSIFIFGLVSINILTQISNIISYWLGEKYIISESIVILLTIKFFIMGIRTPVLIAKTAGGIFEKDKYAPMCEGIISLVLALLLVDKYGIIGILIAQLISLIIVPLWIQPYITYKYVFFSNIINYIKKLSVILLIAFVSMLVSIILLNYINQVIPQNNIFSLVLKSILVSLSYSISFLLLTCRSTEFNILKSKVKSTLIY
ncbi:lipopolysaccharide biosynthesis protein [Arsenophonus nasoniae]|uniref:lipopolysaccharide biosynthesis protein n=1 Tax=Arsenophonus nasoniae TaxID=638 RepID=UPI00387946CD